MALRVYNTLKRKKEEFQPIEGKKVGIYVCGPTVYDDCHIGHARAYINFDVIVRYLSSKGYSVKYIRNITDVDDKIIKKANDEGSDFNEIALRYTNSFHQDLDTLGLLKPDVEPKASEHMADMQNIIGELLKKNFAYESSGDIYFSVKKFKGYAKLSKRRLDEMEAGARVEVSREKKNPFDFALWKKAKKGEPAWDSPWGKGRPGWHIECSAMSSKYLGDTFDIHGGGRDLIFPHHENEIAQSEAYSGEPLAKYWIHNGFVNIKKEKMSKSLGNIISIKSLLSKYSACSFKCFILSNHYRSPINFSDDLIAEAEKAVRRVYTMYMDVRDLRFDKKLKTPSDEFRKKFSEAMDDDFNTAKALGIFFDYVNKGFTLKDKISAGKAQNDKDAGELPNIIGSLNWASDILGLFKYRFKPEEYFHRDVLGKKTMIKTIEDLISRRVECRKKREWARADEIRDKLMNEYGVELEDKKDGTRWKFVK